LGTADRPTAELICAGLVRLYKAGTTSLDCIPKDVPTEATRLYFDIKDDNHELVVKTSDLTKLAAVQANVKHYCRQCHAPALIDAMKREQLAQENEGLRVKNTGLLHELKQLHNDFDAFRRSAIGRITNAAKDIPEMDKALADLEKHLASTTTAANTRNTWRLRENSSVNCRRK
jgi:hypothetical protein